MSEWTIIAHAEWTGSEWMVSILPAGIASGEAFGTAVVAGPIIATSIASAEAFGTAQLNLKLELTGIASAEAFGSASLRYLPFPEQTWLNVYDDSGNFKARIFEYVKIDECSIRSNTFGILKFLIHQDATGRDQLIKRYWIEVYRQTLGGSDTVWSGVICHVRKSFDEAGDPTRFCEVIARSFEWVPYWRVIVPPSGQDYLVKSGAKVDDAMKHMVREQMETGHVDDANRAMTGFSVEADDTEHGDTKTLAARYENNLGDLLFKWASAYDLDWWVEANCPNATFVLRTKVPRRGSDKSSSVIFNVGRHNLVALEYYEDDLDTGSLCYVGGPGEGATQVVRDVYDGAEPTGWDRREKYVPMANAEYTDELDAAGYAWLDSFGDTLTGVRFELTADEAAKWPNDFDIGDLVTVYDADFVVDKQAEIKEVNLTIDADGQETVTLLVGEPQPSAWDLLQAGLGQFSSFDNDSAPATPANPSHGTSSGLDDDNKYYAILTLDWDDNTELDLTGYQVEVLLTGETKWQTQRTTLSEAIFENLKMGASYRARVKARDNAGNESAYLDFNAAAAISMPTNVAPAVPANPSVSTGTITDNDGKTQANLNCSWDANGEADFSHYEITWTVAAKTRTVKTSTNSHYIFPIDCNAAYSVQIKAIDTADNASAYCVAQTGTTARDTSAPATPTGLTVSAAKKAIRIKITRPSESDWAGCEYHVSTSTGFTPGAGTLVHDGKTTSFHHKTESYVAHYVKVRAYDASGNYSSYCAQGTATPEKIDGTNDIPDNNIPGGKIVNVSITATQIANNTITANQITNNTITAGQIANLTITAAEIANLTITGGKIVNATIGSAKISDLSVDKLTAGSLTVAATIGAGGYFEVAGAFKIDNARITIIGTTSLQFGTVSPVYLKQHAAGSLAIVGNVHTGGLFVDSAAATFGGDIYCPAANKIVEMTGPYLRNITLDTTTGEKIAVSGTTKITSLNADLLDGLHAAVANTASTVVARENDSSVNLGETSFAGDIYPTTSGARLCGGSGAKWSDVYCVTLHEGDHVFEEKACAICTKSFRKGQNLVYHVISVGEEGTRAIPAHINCAEDLVD